MTSPTPSQHCQPMTAAHTKLPWNFDELEGGKPDGCGYIRCQTDNLEISHHGDMGRPRDENLANAALIVEACNSYETLKRRIAVLEMVIAEELYPSDCRDEANAMIVEQIVGGAKA